MFYMNVDHFQYQQLTHSGEAKRPRLGGLHQEPETRRSEINECSVKYIHRNNLNLQIPK